MKTIKNESPEAVMRRMVATIVAAAFAFSMSVVLATPASAYATTGCKWGTGTLRIDYRYVNGSYRTAIKNAVNQYNSATDVSLSLTDTSGPSWTAANTNYGATGWNGNASWSCLFGKTNNSSMKLNQYYVGNDAASTWIKLVWQHEMGHSLGLAHVSGSRNLMYDGGTWTVYKNGITGLTSDEIKGINALY